MLVEGQPTKRDVLATHGGRAFRRIGSRDGWTDTARNVARWGDEEERRAYRPAKKWAIAATAAFRLGTSVEILRPRRRAPAESRLDTAVAE